MTPLQATRIYWPSWTSACQNQGWIMSKGRMLGQRVETYGCPQLTRDIYNPIWNIAESLAAADHCAVIPNHLRHACHTVAFNQDKSSKKLSNLELDKIWALFRILTDPSDQTAMLDYLNPGNHTMKRDYFTLEHNYTRDYVASVCRDKYGHSNWGYLSPEELRELVITIKNRPNAIAKQPATSTIIYHLHSDHLAA